MTVKQWLKSKNVKWDESENDGDGRTEFIVKTDDDDSYLGAVVDKDTTGGYLDMTITIYDEGIQRATYNGCSDDNLVSEALENMEMQ